MMAELLEMDIVNNSIYDWPTALGEAALMCNRLNKRKYFLVPEIINPERLSTLINYTRSVGIEIKKIKYDYKTGKIDIDDLKNKVDDETSGIYIENPSYIGIIEDQGDEISSICKEINTLFIVGVDPTSLGIFKPPGSYGADIVVGEGQPFGSPMNYGGPLLGIFAVREDRKMIRQIPGRLTGITTTEKGDEKGFVMTLSSREQHIKREKATSNICTNQGLMSIAAAIYMAALGKSGITKLSKNVFYNTQYLIKKLKDISHLKVTFLNSIHFKEFSIEFENNQISAQQMQKQLFRKGLIVGKNISNEFPTFKNALLLSTTEVHLKKDLDYLIESIEEVVMK
jgi:glycine dehydrogenase subunit 1